MHIMLGGYIDMTGRSLGSGTATHFWLADTNDSWYRANGRTTVRPLNSAARAASNFAGTELDAVITWQPSKHFALEAGYCRFFGGDYLADTGASDDANFGYVQTTISF